MESEEVLTSIMSKLKEYKSNPLPTLDEEKERQKQLIKMFCIYTSLKKREKARQKIEEQEAMIQKETNEENQLNNVNDYEQTSEFDPCENDRISSNNLTVNTDENEFKTDSEMLAEYVSDEPEEFCSDFSPTNDEHSKSERDFDETEESLNETVEEHEDSLNQFLVQLSERLKKLPYRQRSKLEIEFFRRVIEVEDCLRSYNN